MVPHDRGVFVPFSVGPVLLGFVGGFGRSGGAILYCFFQSIWMILILDKGVAFRDWIQGMMQHDDDRGLCVRALGLGICCFLMMIGVCVA